MISKKLLFIAGTLFVFAGCGGGGSTTPTDAISDTPVPADAISDTPAPTTSGQEPVVTAPVLLSDEKQAYLDVINEARAMEQDCGTMGIKAPVPALVWNEALYKSSYEHSQDLALNNAEGHDGTFTSSDISGIAVGHASTPQNRVDYNGYVEYKNLAENVAYGTNIDTPQEAIDEWIKSDTHCDSLMDGNLTEVGMALFTKEGSHYTNYWTQDFGAR